MLPVTLTAQVGETRSALLPVPVLLSHADNEDLPAKLLLGWLIFDTGGGGGGGVSGLLTCCAGISNRADRGGGWAAAELPPPVSR